MKREMKIITKAQKTIKKYADDPSIYYKELVKSYKEYKNTLNLDKTTKDLYLEHLNRLSDFIVQKRHANIIIAIMIFMLICMLFLTSYSTYRYYDISKNLKENIIKANEKTAIIVNYNDLDNFNVLTIIDEIDYMSLRPLTLSIYAKSEEKINKNIIYNIYLIEQNEDIHKDNLLNRNAFLYNVITKDDNTGIKEIKNCHIDNNKILIYSGKISENNIEDVAIRMWIDRKTKIDYQNKQYRFKLFVTGYLEK